MDNNYPMAMLKAPGPFDIHGGKFDYRSVKSEEEEAEALADGWYHTTDEAKEAYRLAELAKTLVEKPSPVCDGPFTTREQLQDLAKALGLDVHPQLGIKRLQEEIAKAVAAKQPPVVTDPAT